MGQRMAGDVDEVPQAVSAARIPHSPRRLDDVTRSIRGAGPLDRQPALGKPALARCQGGAEVDRPDPDAERLERERELAPDIGLGEAHLIAGQEG
jgi:hypothetical protein